MEEPGEKQTKNTNYGACAFWCLILLLISIGGLVFAVGKCHINFTKFLTKNVKIIEVYWTISGITTGKCIRQTSINIRGNDLVIRHLKEYYEIIDEARPLSGFFPTHADLFTKMNF